MSTWPVQDAKARFSEFLDACTTDGPQIVTKRGVEAAVLVPVDQWRRLQAAARPSLKELLLAEHARFEPLVPERGQARRRKIESDVGQVNAHNIGHTVRRCDDCRNRPDSQPNGG